MAARKSSKVKDLPARLIDPKKAANVKWSEENLASWSVSSRLWRRKPIFSISRRRYDEQGQRSPQSARA